MKCSTVLVVLGLVLVAAQNNHQELMKKLQAAKRVTNQQIHAIHMEWNIDQYPNFLKSCSMHRNGWLELIMRFVLSILDSNIETEHLTNEFVISFTGSSVTAGHDSFFNQSYPIVTSDWMKPAFAAAGVDLVVRNVAFGNNPCMPYDPCVGTIAGFDADMVHWEQSYNCFDQPMYEQFVRQAAFLPKKPLVIYSESSTANW